MKEIDNNDYVVIESIGLLMYLDKNRAHPSHNDVEEELIGMLKKSLTFKRGSITIGAIEELINQGLINFVFVNAQVFPGNDLQAFKGEDLDIEFLENVLFFVGEQTLRIYVELNSSTPDFLLQNIKLSELVKLLKEMN